MVIHEVFRRLDQGVTRPFLCRADDGERYVVKGRGGRDTLSLCREWIAGRLARAFGLPVPPFAMVEVPAELIAGSDLLDIKLLGSGLAFASLWVDEADEFSSSHLSEVLLNIKPQLLLFDRWIHNGDRSLTGHGGNPNLLWKSRERTLHVIDHNNAFDGSFDLPAFWETHVFRGSSNLWTNAFRTEMTARLADTLELLDFIWSELPEEWLWVNADLAIPTNIILEEVRNMLSQPWNDPINFWRNLA